MPARRKSGFTLIELLVVIAIIAILAAILFPVFARAREAARKSNCANNLKELAIALQTYWTDYDATLPSSASYDVAGTQTAQDANQFKSFSTKLGLIPVPTSVRAQTWVQLLYPCMKSRDIMFCPSDSESHDYASSNVSYQWKYAIDKAWWQVGTGTDRCMKESDFGFTADQIVFFERAGFHDNKSAGVANNTKINVVFLDTHVKSGTLINCAAEGSGTTVDTKTTAVSTGEPWYFNYDQETVKSTSNPPASNVRPIFDDPRRYSDYLP